MSNKTIIKVIFLIVLCLICRVTSEGIGESCSQDGVAGTCTALSQCQAVLDNPGTQWWKLHRCGTKDLEPIICCVGSAVTAVPGPVATTSRQGSPTTEYSPPDYEYHTSEPLAGGCAVPALAVTPARTGRRAWDKCIDYQLELVYPCEPGVALLQDMRRANHCKRNTEDYIASQDDFEKHVVMLYRVTARGDTHWACSGTLLSNRFILTIAYCTLPLRGALTLAKVGAPTSYGGNATQRMYTIKRVIRHPEYQEGKLNHDIALLETATEIVLDQFTIPACLDVFGDDASHTVEATWETYPDDALRKVAFIKEKQEECQKNYGDFNQETEICYGTFNPPQLCMGYGGGPLFAENHKVHCMYSVVGIASSSAWCGDVPRKFTRISHYIPWIESIIWA